MLRPVWLVPVAVGIAFAQTNGGLKREGPYWIQTMTGAVTVAPGSKLKIGARGPVVVRGEERRDVVYTLKKRARARNTEEAGRALEGWSVKTKTAGEVTYLVVQFTDAGSPAPELEVHAPRKLAAVIIENQGGSVEARDLDGDVTAATSGGRIYIDRIGRSVAARTGGGDVQLGRIGGSAQCLSGGGSISVDSVAGESWFETVGGEIRVREAGGPVRASAAGNIVVERAAQSVTAQTSGGMIEVQQAGGPVSVEASGGSVQIGSAANVRCELGAGPIRLTGVSGALRASTGLGTVLANLLAGASFQDSILNTGNGDVIVTIPSNVSLRIWAQSDSVCRGGKIVSEFSEIRIRQADAPCLRPMVAEGNLNGGGPLLRVSASGGAVYLRRTR